MGKQQSDQWAAWQAQHEAERKAEAEEKHKAMLNLGLDIPEVIPVHPIVSEWTLAAKKITSLKHKGKRVKRDINCPIRSNGLNIHEAAFKADLLSQATGNEKTCDDTIGRSELLSALDTGR